MVEKALYASIVFVIAGFVALAHVPTERLPAGVKADWIVVEKGDRRLELLREGEVLKIYPISLGHSPIGHKEREGDNRTPEGIYEIDWRNENSSCHLSLHISYPSPLDAALAKMRGVSPGGDIMIHGLPQGFGWLGVLHRLFDWTAGCIAVTNREIEEIWQAVPNGTIIEIRQ